MLMPDRQAPLGQEGLLWLADHAWPLWLEHGVDWRGRAFHEHLDSSLQCEAPFRRLRVAARQTYAFSSAARYGVPRAKEAVALGLDFLRGPARLPDGGFAWRFDLDSRPTDSTRDLYDHAFVLLAFAAAAEVMGADRVHADAIAVADYIATQFVHPAGGYRDNIPGSGPRRQNPHMHLFEALLAAGDAFRDERFFNWARDLAALFFARFFQAKEGALPEYFDEALAPCLETGQFLVEPGHHYEWIWLLRWYEKSAAAFGVPAAPHLTSAARSLFEFAERYAVSAANRLVMNGLWSDGTIADGGFRLWPQTERLKAVARLQPDRAPQARAGIARHLAGARPGLWIERINADGQEIVQATPATSLYHLTAAFTDDAVLPLIA